MPELLRLTHLIGLGWGLGAATVKTVLLLRCFTDRSLLASYLPLSRTITRHIVLGMVVLTLSGIGFLVLGYPVTRVLVTKLVLVAAIWVLGPIIDNVAEPKLRRLAPAAGAPASPEFLHFQKRHLALELLAAGLFYAIVVVWVMR
jgi:hypothetical protein